MALSMYYSGAKYRPQEATLDKMLRNWLESSNKQLANNTAIVLWTLGGMDRKIWNPILTSNQVKKIKTFAIRPTKDDFHHGYYASLVVAFYAKNVWSDEELAKRLRKSSAAFPSGPYRRYPVKEMLRQLRPMRAKKHPKRHKRRI